MFYPCKLYFQYYVIHITILYEFAFGYISAACTRWKRHWTPVHWMEAAAWGGADGGSDCLGFRVQGVAFRFQVLWFRFLDFGF